MVKEAGLTLIRDTSAPRPALATSGPAHARHGVAHHCVLPTPPRTRGPVTRPLRNQHLPPIGRPTHDPTHPRLGPSHDPPSPPTGLLDARHGAARHCRLHTRRAPGDPPAAPPAFAAY